LSLSERLAAAMANEKWNMKYNMENEKKRLHLNIFALELILGLGIGGW